MASHAGSFLVARPSLQDPHFRRAVVLLLQHNEEGAFGLVVNRPALAPGLPLPVYGGGPCPSPGLMMLHGHPDWLGAEKASAPAQIAPGVFLGDSECFRRVSQADELQTFRFRLFKGYAGWGPQQLERELAAGAWDVIPANGQLLFDTPVAELWSLLAPSTLPQPSVN